MAFNPEDFVFEKVSLPEHDPTILEYDAMAGLIVVRAEDQYGNVEHQCCSLTRKLNENLLSGLPDKFTTRNDRIIQFYIRTNGKYKLTKEKLKYDFKRKESKWTRYEYTTLTEEELKELFQAFKTAIWVQNTLNQEEIIQETIELAKKPAYMNSMYAKDRDEVDRMLRSSDWRVLPDYPEQYEGEQKDWVTWRDQLRNLVRNPAEFDTELEYLIYKEELRWPYNPDTVWNQIDIQREHEYLQHESHWSKSSSVNTTSESIERITANVNAYIAAIKERKEDGIPITKQMYDTINKYRLIESIENIGFNPRPDEVDFNPTLEE